MFDVRDTTPPILRIDQVVSDLQSEGYEPKKLLDARSNKLKWSLDVASAASILGYDSQSIRYFFESGKLTGYRASEKKIVIWLDSVIEYQKGLQIGVESRTNKHDNVGK